MTVVTDELFSLVHNVMLSGLDDEVLDPDDNFFSLGGSSLAAMKVAVTLRRELGLPVPVNAVALHPTPAALSTHLSQLTADSPPVPTDGEVAGDDQPGGDASEDASDEMPLTRPQLRIWDALQVSPEAGVLNVYLAFQLRGPVQPERLREAVRVACQWHEGARTAVVPDPVRPRQAVAPEPSIEWCDLTGEVNAASVAARFIELARRPIDPVAGPLVRVAYADTGEDLTAVVVVVHHLFFDTAALMSFLRSVSRAYDDPHRRDWQLASQRSHVRWRTALEARAASPGGNREGSAESPQPDEDSRCWFQRQRRNPKDVEGDYLAQPWPRSLTTKVRELARRTNSTVFVVFAAAVAAYLWRTGSGDRVVIGLPISERMSVAGDGLADGDGYQVRQERLVVPVDPGGTFTDLVRATKPAIDDLLTQSPDAWIPDSTFPAICLGPQDDLLSAFRLGNAAVEQLIVHNRTSKVELGLPFFDDGVDARVDAEFLTQSCATDDVRTMLSSLMSFTENLVTDATTPLHNVPVVADPGGSPSLRRVTDRPFASTISIHERFQEAAARWPDRPALEASGLVISYRQLDRASSRIGELLQMQGYQPGTAVAVRMGRTPLLIASLLGVLKAGGHYIVLSSSDPPERHRLVVSRSRAVMVLGDREGPDLGVPNLVLPEFPADGPAEFTPAPADPLDPACAFFTSGSTGEAKAILSPHLATLRTVDEQVYAALSGRTRMLQVAAPQWDAFTLEVWGPLLNGGTCVVYPQEVLDLELLGRVLREQRINTLFLTTRLFDALVDLDPDAMTGVEEIMMGGEAVSVDHLRRLREMVDGNLLHCYGPAEATTFSTTYPVPRPFRDTDGTVPIGRAVHHTEVYLLDPYGHPVPPGTPGEICVAGPGLALGYQGDPAYTAQRFLPDPWGPPGSRMYRTGDIGVLVDGELIFRGRRDRQVKVAGGRVDLSEVENEISRLTDAPTVVELDSTGGHSRLVAWVGVAERAVPELRRAIERVLPRTHVPARIVAIEDLPLTATGKADRAVLRKAMSTSTEGKAMSNNDDQTRGHVRAVVIAVVAEELGESVDEDTDLFARGGNSLTAAQIAQRLSHLLGIRVASGDVLRNSQTSDLVQVIYARGAGPDEFARSAEAASHLVSIPRSLRASVAGLA